LAVAKSLSKKTGRAVKAGKTVRSKPAAKRAPAPPARDKGKRREPVRQEAVRRPIRVEATRKEAVVKKKSETKAAPTNLPSPTATPVKARKNQAGLNARELEHFREMLLARRRDLVGDMSSMEREALRTGGTTNLSNLPMHMADMGTDNYEQEFTLGLVEKDRMMLREINSALAKIQAGTYGICEGTGNPISKARLEAQPWARFSIEYARKVERGEIRS
jgi:RNA polymerase-binding protein DksA